MVVIINDSNGETYKIDMVETSVGNEYYYVGKGVDKSGNDMQIEAYKMQIQQYVSEQNISLSGDIFTEKEDIANQITDHLVKLN